jgi:hypothetical protein
MTLALVVMFMLCVMMMISLLMMNATMLSHRMGPYSLAWGVSPDESYITESQEQEMVLLEDTY